MNIYLDIDGVILANDKQPAKFAKEFLKFITDNYDVYWLTTHCKGDADYSVNFINRFFEGGNKDRFDNVAHKLGDNHLITKDTLEAATDLLNQLLPSIE